MHKLFSVSYLLKIVFIWFALIAAHQQIASSSQTKEEQQVLLMFYNQSDLDITKIATKTKMHSDLSPGIITILKGEDLKLRGVRTVFDALKLVPGVYTYKNSLGERIVAVRGIGGDLYSGNLKIMLDGIDLNESLSAAGYAIYEIPIEQVDRIEIIRGPGSVVYGEYAYSGVINVKLLKKGNRVYARMEGDEKDALYSYGGGGTLTYENPQQDLLLNLNLSGWRSDGPDVQAGQDRLYAGILGLDFGDYSYAPGPTNEAHEDRFASLYLQYKKFSLQSQYLSVGNGDYFGMVQVLPPPEDRADHFHNYQTIEAQHKNNLAGTFDLGLKVGWRRYEQDLKDPKVLPFIAFDDNSILDTPTIAGVYYEENEIYCGTELISKRIDRHTVLFGLKYSHIEMGDTWVDSNSYNSEARTESLTGELNWIREHQKRGIFSLYSQDVFDVTPQFALTGGLRYDHYDNHNDQVGPYDYATPRITAVYRCTDHHIFKAQYSQGVRPPTFSELYTQANSLFRGNPNLEPENIRSWELGYILRDDKTIGRLTLFFSELDDKIDYPDTADPLSLGMGDISYVNIDYTIRSKGFELEFAHEITPGFHVNTNLSFTDAQGINSEPIYGSVKWLANIGLVYYPLDDYALTLQDRYVGKRKRAPEDPRDDLKYYNTLDLSVNISNFLSKGISLRAGINNLFSADIHYPAPAFKDYQGNIDFTYPDDFPRPGGEGWIQLSYDI